MSNDSVEEMNDRIRAQRAQRQRDQGAYGELFNEVARILYQHDFMSLATIGCPIDEYEPETRSIIPRLHEAASRDELANIIEDEFVRSFSGQSPVRKNGSRKSRGMSGLRGKDIPFSDLGNRVGLLLG